MTAVAILAAAGSGTRLGVGRPKALVAAAGRPLVRLAAERLVAAGILDLVVVHPPQTRVETGRALDGLPARTLTLVEGGRTRTDSVRAGVAALPEGEVVAIHDAARCLVPAEVIRRAVAAVTGEVIAAAPGLPVVDTLKEVDDEGTVHTTVTRSSLWAVHTPQVIRRDILDAVLSWSAGAVATDDLALVEAARDAGVVSGRIVIVPGDVRDLKVTYPADLELVAALLETGRG